MSAKFCVDKAALESGSMRREILTDNCSWLRWGKHGVHTRCTRLLGIKSWNRSERIWKINLIQTSFWPVICLAPSQKPQNNRYRVFTENRIVLDIAFSQKLQCFLQFFSLANSAYFLSSSSLAVNRSARSRNDSALEASFLALFSLRNCMACL